MILVVEDSDFCRHALEQLLGEAGYGVVSAANGEQALNLLRAGGIDLVILDLLLPDISGNEVLEEVLRMGRAMPVVVFSAELGELKESLRSMPTALVDKGSGAPALMELVAKVQETLPRQAP